MGIVVCPPGDVLVAGLPFGVALFAFFPCHLVLLRSAALASPSFSMLVDWPTLFGNTASVNNNATASWTPFWLVFYRHALTRCGTRLYLFG